MYDIVDSNFLVLQLDKPPGEHGLNISYYYMIYDLTFIEIPLHNGRYMKSTHQSSELTKPKNRKMALNFTIRRVSIAFHHD